MTAGELTPDDIDDLARRAQEGDRDALEALLTAVRPRCLNVCRGVLPYSGDAEDACQEALINIANKIGSWHRNGRFTTWMHVVAVNSARTTYRRMKNQAFSSDVLPLEKPDPRTTSVIAGSRLDFLEALEVLGTDHPTLVEPLLLRDLQELEYADIADLLDIPVGTVKSRIHSARQFVQPMLRG
jgi:RNA polymerase sigma-70 factor (ECF subfamily)